MISLVISLVCPFLFLLVFTTEYSVAQSQHYEIGKYFKYNFNKKLIVQCIGLVFLCISFFISNIERVFLLIALVLFLHFILYKSTCKLKITNRIKRVIVIYFSITYIFFLLPLNKTILAIILGSFFYVYLLVIHLVSCCIEKAIMEWYIKDAKRIIKGIKVIGITGSYGKTSCKNILYDMLESIVNVSKTPKSYNNKVGIVKSIRECVNSEDEYFICEYGVDKKGAMDKLLKIVKPNISLITEVGPQHLLTFKNIDNIKNEKIKVAKILLKKEWAVINNDNKYLRECVKELKCNVISYGIKENSDIMAKNIIMSNKGASFDLYMNGEKYKSLDICLLGEHNILNVLGAIGVLKCMGIDLKVIDKLVAYIKPVEHRLQLKDIQGIKVIDDSFNSNEVGFKKAIDVLNLMDEEKYVLTPGIIEQGKNSEQINYELGKYMANKIDYAILVEDNAEVLKKGLIDGGFIKEKIVVKKDFKEAWTYINKKDTKGKIFLIENDLPSIYLK